MRGKDDSEIIGKTFHSNNCGDFIVLGRAYTESTKNKKFTVRFLDTGYEKDTYRRDIEDGKVWNPFHKGEYGEFFGDPYQYGYTANYTDRKIYAIWGNIVDRLHNPDNKDYDYYGGAGVTLCPEWYCFANFYRDYTNMPRYNEWLAGTKLELDKDVLQQDKPINEKIYSPTTCALIKKGENIADMNTRNHPDASCSYYGVRVVESGNYAVGLQRDNKAICREITFTDPYSAAVYRDYVAKANYMPAMNNVPISDADFFKALEGRSYKNPPKQLYRVIDKNKEDT